MELDESWMGADTVVVDDVVAEVVCATSIISDIGKVTGGVVMEDQGSPSWWIIEIEDQAVIIDVGDIIQQDIGEVVSFSNVEGPEVLYNRGITGNPADHWSGNFSIARRVVSIVVVIWS